MEENMMNAQQSDMAMAPIMVDTRAAARMLGLRPITLTVWRSQGRGPKFVRVSPRCVMYRVKDLEEWAASLVVQSTKDPLPE